MFFIWFVIPAFSPIDKPVKQRYDKEADRRTDGHRAYHGDRQRLLQFRSHIRGEQQRHHGKDGRQRSHDNRTQTPAACFVNSFQQRNACLAQFIDRIQFQDRVMITYHRSPIRPMADHRFSCMPAYPEQEQSKCHINRDFRQYQQRLQKTLELCGKNEIHQQQ